MTTTTTIKMEDQVANFELEYESDSVASDSDAGADESPVNDADRCKYPSKFCGRARVRKSNGTFHRYCEYHRIKANANQKRWTKMRRQQAAQEEQRRRYAEAYQTLHGPKPTALGGAAPGYRMAYGRIPDPINIDPSPEPVDLALEDVQILNALFVVGETPPEHNHVREFQPNAYYHHPATRKQYPFEYSDIAL